MLWLTPIATLSRDTPQSDQSMKPTPKAFASRLAPSRNKLTHSLPLIRPSACPSTSHRFPRAPFSVLATAPSTSSRFPASLARIETRSLPTLTRSYPRRFTFYVACPAAPFMPLTHSRRIVVQRLRWLISFSLDVMRSREAAGCDWASQPHLLDTAFVAGTMGKKAAWQQANPFHNISNDRGGARK